MCERERCGFCFTLPKKKVTVGLSWKVDLFGSRSDGPTQGAADGTENVLIGVYFLDS